MVLLSNSRGFFPRIYSFFAALIAIIFVFINTLKPREKPSNTFNHSHSNELRRNPFEGMFRTQSQTRSGQQGGGVTQRYSDGDGPGGNIRSGFNRGGGGGKGPDAFGGCGPMGG